MNIDIILPVIIKGFYIFKKIKHNLKTNTGINKFLLIIYFITAIITFLLLNQYIYLAVINDEIKGSYINLSILSLIETFIILYILFKYMQNKIIFIENSYEELKDKDRLIPFQISVDNSQEAIHWFTKEGKYIYVNKATCDMDGYSKEEFLNMYLDEVDKNFTREQLPEVMQAMIDTDNWKIVTTHTKKNGEIITLEVTGHGFIYNKNQYICAFARDITAKQKYERKISYINNKLTKSLNENKVLFKEVHHRVKNNMEIISSILSMQSRRSNNIEVKNIIKEGQSRIHTMALVHEFLYLGEDLSSININSYLSKLILDIESLYNVKEKVLNIDIDIDPLIFSTDKCIEIGMVIHEICVNSFKYAFMEKKDNLLCIHLKRVDDVVKLKIRDNGKGLNDLNLLKKSNSIGMQLITSIIENQLDGIISYKNNNGLEFNIEFPMKGTTDEYN